MKLWLIFLLYTRTIFSKVIITDNSIYFQNNIINREDWINSAKYYASNHKPYNVKKYVSYRPSNKNITRTIPKIPGFSSTTAVPDVATNLFETSTTFNDLDYERTTGFDQSFETTSEMAFDSTTETYSSTTELPETSTMLLSIIGNVPGIETTTSIPYNEALEETTRRDDFGYTTSEIPYLDVSTETVISTTTDPETTSEETISTTTAATDLVDSTTQQYLSLLKNSSMDNDVTSTTIPAIETTTELSDSKTILSTSTTEAWSGNDTTTLEPVISESTTERIDSTTQQIFSLFENSITDKFVISTTKPGLDTTTEKGETTTELLRSTTEIPSSTTQITPSENDDTTTESVSPESTTERQQNFNVLENSGMDELVTISPRLETTTEERDSTTELATSTTESPSANDTTTEIGSFESSININAFENTTEGNADTELTTTEKITTITGGNANFNGDIIQPKPRKFTYSSDVMPEPYW
ncbi:serine-rich adhesin for platelets-like [Drosophila innubila]|uniref:serine-rich adhesin for platelets-like n=1 Tax=Drosophila innubila TaxID=198719 RepID=UPI00148D3148|nr:serine-rich adhesin for platelets-like [Drosophila innubila]